MRIENINQLAEVNHYFDFETIDAMSDDDFEIYLDSGDERDLEYELFFNCEE